MFITRRQYDYLVRTQPDWMRTKWLELNRSWDLYGVWVSGDISLLNGLQSYL